MKRMNGLKMLRVIAKFEDECEKRTDKQIPRMGKKAPQCVEYLGQVLAYADMIGSCVYACPGPSQKAHATRYLVARSSSFGRASLRLAKLGFYDEALVLVRSMGETANLFELFALAPPSVEEWKNSDRLYRLKHFSPAQVRKRIVELGESPAMDEVKYASLCEVSTHPVPELRPQRFNHAGRSMTGGIILQPAGFLVVLNEMALVVSLLAVFAAKVCEVSGEQFEAIGKACLMCAKSAGNIDLERLETIWHDLETKQTDK